MQDAIVCDLKARAVGYQYCNIQCFCKMYYKRSFDAVGRIQWDWDEPDMSKFGEYAVIITDQAEFTRRVITAANAAGCKVICGPVNYHPILDGDAIVTAGTFCTMQRMDAISITDLLSDTSARRYDAFDKWDKFQKQNEWRIVINSGLHDTKAYRLEIGALDDIAIKVSSKDLACKVRKLLTGFRVQSSVEGYDGNISRVAMRDEFYHMGEDKAHMLAVLGCAEYE